MAISRFSTSTVAQGLPKYQKLWDGTSTYSPSSYYSIATATVTSGGTGSITFSSIPQTFKHLQVRISTRAIAAGDYTYGTFRVGNTSVDTGYNYWYHGLSGIGTTATPIGAASGSNNYANYALSMPGDAMSSNLFGTAVLDIYDYTSTGAFKTMKSIFGYSNNDGGSSDTMKGRAGINTSIWRNTSAIDTLNFADSGGYNFAQYTTISLYGIKG